MDCDALDAWKLRPNETSRVNSSFLREQEDARLDLLNFHADRCIIDIALSDNPPADGVANCRLKRVEPPGGLEITVPSTESFSQEDTPVLARMIPFCAFAILLVSMPRAMVLAQTAAKKPTSIFDFTMKDIDGKDVPLAKFHGKVLLIVNTASQCGNTPQYKGLEEIYKKYKDHGFEILAFPANEFGCQEPGTDEQIKQFCASNYNVSFPLFSKIVVKGKRIHPLYGFLTSEATNPKYAGDITWNFAKFLVNRKGEVVARYQPDIKPESSELYSAIEKALAEK
jgi:glutathione peroxidase